MHASFNSELIGLTKASGFGEQVVSQVQKSPALGFLQRTGRAAWRNRGPLGLIAAGAVAHDQGETAFDDWRRGRAYRQQVEQAQRA